MLIENVEEGLCYLLLSQVCAQGPGTHPGTCRVVEENVTEVVVVSDAKELLDMGRSFLTQETWGRQRAPVGRRWRFQNRELGTCVSAHACVGTFVSSHACVGTFVSAHVSVVLCVPWIPELSWRGSYALSRLHGEFMALSGVYAYGGEAPPRFLSAMASKLCSAWEVFLAALGFRAALRNSDA